MREKLSPEEYKKRKWKMWYQDNREHHIQKELERYRRNRKEEEELLEEIYKDVYDPIPEPIDYDAYYTEKFKKDDLSGWHYSFAWRSSKICFLDWKRIPKYKLPFRVADRKWMSKLYRHIADIEYEAYLYIKPHMEEIKDCYISIEKKLKVRRHPWRYTNWRLKELIEDADINATHICTVTDWIRRNKYIVWMTYLWRNSFIFGDVFVTQTGHEFRISLENNLPWLTPDTVEDIHNLRMEWRRKKGKIPPPLYIVNDAYLIKVKPNEREEYFYITSI